MGYTFRQYDFKDYPLNCQAILKVIHLFLHEAAQFTLRISFVRKLDL